MAWRPPSWTPPDASRNNSNAIPHSERGGAQTLLPSQPSLPASVQAKMMNTAAAFPPPKPMQPSYIPPSPQVRFDHQSLAPWNLPSHSSYRHSTLSNSPQPEHQTPMNHHPPFSPYRSSTMASTTPSAADTSPLWLEPSPQHRQARNDPFFSTKGRGYGPTSSPSRFALSRGTPMSFEQGAPSYQSNTMGNHVPDIPSEKSEDRYATHTFTNRL